VFQLYLKANKPFTRVLMHARDSNKRVPVKHLYRNDVRPPLREMEDSGLINIHRDQKEGYTINLTKRGYKEGISILGFAQ
jgi:hypothetical protein